MAGTIFRAGPGRVGLFATSAVEAVWKVGVFCVFVILSGAKDLITLDGFVLT